MIQRIQTIWYLLAALAVLAVFVFPVPLNNPANVQEVKLRLSGTYWMLTSWYLHPLEALIILGAIFSFKKLKIQLMLGRIALVIYFLLLVGWVIEGSFIAPVATADEIGAKQTLLGPGFFIFLAGLIFLALGNSGVRKDKKLIDSLNRLR